MAAIDMTSFDAALKVHYTDARIKMMAYKKNPLLAILPKMESFGGRNLPIPIIYGTPKGRSADFATAQANKAPGDYEAFEITRVKNYGLASLDNETMEASEGNENAFMRAATTEIDGILHTVTRDLAVDIFRSGTGSRGVRGSVSSNDLTLSNKYDVTNFMVGMRVVASQTDGGALRTGSALITAINRVTGVLTAATSGSQWSDISSFANGDTLYAQGDAAAASTNKKMAGLAAWIPASDPSSTPFFGVNRAVDPTRLGGVRYDGSLETIEEALISGGVLLAREGGMPDVAVVNHFHYGELLKALGSRVVYDTLNASDVTMSFETIKLHTPTGVVKVLPDQNCPTGVAYMLTLDTWKLYSLGAAPRILQSDGNRFLREASADSVEVRTGYYAQMGCNAPGYNARITLAT